MHIRPQTFPLQYEKGSFRREGCVVIIIPNDNVEVTADNVAEYMPPGLTCAEFVKNTITKAGTAGITHQIVVVQVEGWTEYVEVSPNP